MHTEVDRSSPLPLWTQVRDDLRRRLDAGEITDHFPGDVELMATYGVSRHTVREAVRHLQESGLIVRERGRGTRVRPGRIEQPLGTLYSLFRSVEDQGYAQCSTVRTLEQRTNAEAATVLGLAPDAPLVFLERVRLADDEPIALDCSWLPATIALPLLEVDFTRTALYSELASRCGVRPRSGWEQIRPQLPEPRHQEILGLGAAEPVFAIERLTRTLEGPLEWRHSVVRGDRFAFVARWSDEGTTSSGIEHAEPDPTPG